MTAVAFSVVYATRVTVFVIFYVKLARVHRLIAITTEKNATKNIRAHFSSKLEMFEDCGWLAAEITELRPIIEAEMTERLALKEKSEKKSNMNRSTD